MLLAGANKPKRLGVKEGDNIAAPKQVRIKMFLGLWGKSPMVSLLSLRFPHLSERAVSVLDCLGQSLLLAWESLEPFLGVGTGW